MRRPKAIPSVVLRVSAVAAKIRLVAQLPIWRTD